MWKSLAISFVFIVMFTVLLGTAAAQDTPSITLLGSQNGSCVVTLRINDIAASSSGSPVLGPLQGYDIELSYPTSITVNATTITTWFNGFDPTFASGCSNGTCRFVYVKLGQNTAVSGSGDIQELVLTGTGMGSLTIGDFLLSNPSGLPISATTGNAIDVETCAPTAIGEPLGIAGHTPFGNTLLVALSIVGLGALTIVAVGRRSRHME